MEDTQIYGARLRICTWNIVGKNYIYMALIGPDTNQITQDLLGLMEGKIRC